MIKIINILIIILMVIAMIKNQNKRKGVRRNYDWNNFLSYDNHLHYTNKKSFKI